MKTYRQLLCAAILCSSGVAVLGQCSAAPGSGTGCLNGRTIQGVPVDAKATAPALLSKQIVNHPLPSYPQAAAADHVEGLVSALILVGKDGRVEKVLGTDGPPQLLRAATEALRQWTYQPVLDGGKPVRAMSTIFLNFKLGTAGGAQTEPSVEYIPAIARISGGVAAGMIKTKVQPDYPEDAKAKGIVGAVVMQALIGADGSIESLFVISGPGELREASLKAVKQLAYRPYLLNGAPVPVETTVTVNFNGQ